MGLYVPEWLGTMFLVVTGESWPEADEDGLRQLAEAWRDFAAELTGVEAEVDAAGHAVGVNWVGQGADAFNVRMNELASSGVLGQVRVGAEQVSTYANDAALNVEYAKYSIIGQLVILAAQIAELIVFLFTPAAPAAAGAIAALQAWGRFLAASLVRRLVLSLAVNLLLQVGLDVAIQVAQIAEGNRTRWDTRRTLGAFTSAVVSTGLGEVLGLLTRLGAKLVGASLMDSLVVHAGRGALHEWGSEWIADQILTGRREAPSGWSASAGAVEGALDWAGGRSRGALAGTILPGGLDITLDAVPGVFTGDVVADGTFVLAPGADPAAGGAALRAVDAYTGLARLTGTLVPASGGAPLTGTFVGQVDLVNGQLSASPTAVPSFIGTPAVQGAAFGQWRGSGDLTGTFTFQGRFLPAESPLPGVAAPAPVTVPTPAPATSVATAAPAATAARDAVINGPPPVPAATASLGPAATVAAARDATSVAPPPATTGGPSTVIGESGGTPGGTAMLPPSTGSGVESAPTPTGAAGSHPALAAWRQPGTELRLSDDDLIALWARYPGLRGLPDAEVAGLLRGALDNPGVRENLPSRRGPRLLGGGQVVSTGGEHQDGAVSDAGSMVPTVGTVTPDTASAMDAASMVLDPMDEGSTAPVRTGPAVASTSAQVPATEPAQVLTEPTPGRPELDAEELGQVARLAGLTGPDAPARTAEVAAIHYQLHRLDPAAARAVHLSELREVIDLAGSDTRMDLADLLPLVRATVDPATTTVTGDAVVRLTEAIRALKGRRGVTVDRVTRYFLDRAAKGNGPDGTGDRARELADLRSRLDEPTAGRALRERALRALVTLRREALDPRSRAYGGVGSYGALLGQPDTPLASIVDGVERVLREHPLRVPVRVALGELARVVVARDWSTGTPPPRTESAHNIGVPGLHYVDRISDGDGLVEWLNSLVPGARPLRTDDVLGPLSLDFSAALDGGVRLDVGGDHVAYRITLRPEASGPPRRNDEAPSASRKGELRVNTIESDVAYGSVTGRSGSVDAGVAARFGEAGVTVTTTGSVGAAYADTTSVTTNAATGRYMYVKPDERFARYDVPVVWSAVVTDIATGRWREATRDDGNVSLFALPSAMDTGRVEPARADHFPLWTMHHVVERVHGVGALRDGLRGLLGEAEYRYWQERLELFLSNDRIGAYLADILRQDNGFQEVPRLTLRSGDRYLSVSLTATPEDTGGPAVQPMGAPSTQVKYDRPSQWMTRRAEASERRGGLRGRLAGVLRLARGILNVGASGGGSYSTGVGTNRAQTNWLLRALRATDTSQLVLVRSTFKVRAAWGVDGRPRRGGEVSADGWAQVRVRSADVDGATTAPPETEPVWWYPYRQEAGNPGIERFGIGYGAVDSWPSGVREAYNALATRLVGSGYLPPEAVRTGVEPWTVLQGLDPTGVDLNQPGVRFRNWRTLVDGLSATMLTRAVDDVLAEGIPLPFAPPTALGRPLTVRLSAAVTGPGTFVRSAPLMPVSTFIGMDSQALRRTTVKGLDAQGTASLALDAVGLAIGGGMNRRLTTRTGLNTSATITTYARTDGGSSLFEVPVELRWTASTDAGDTRFAGTTEGLLRAWQPDSLAGPELARDLPATTDSPFLGGDRLIARAPVSVSGVADLHRAVEQQLGPAPMVVTTSAYKANLPRLLGAGMRVNAGAVPGWLRATPTGPAQLLRRVRVYTEILHESQTGRERDEDVLDTGDVNAGAGYRTGQPGDSGGLVGDLRTGTGSTVNTGRTGGLYRDITDTADAYVVRTAVRNELLLATGARVETNGEVILFVSARDVETADTRLFDDPHELRPAVVTPTPATRSAPPSLRDGRLWTAMWEEPIGARELHRRVAEAAEQVGGSRLAVEVLPLLGGVANLLPNLVEGKHSWRLDVGGRGYKFTLSAHPVDQPSYVDESPSAGLKLYRRANTSTGERSRSTSGYGLGVAAGNRIDESAVVSYGVTPWQPSTEDGRQAGTNLLTMDGERPKGVARFAQRIEFRFTLSEATGRDHPTTFRLKRVTGTVRETYLGNVPLDGTRDAVTVPGPDPARGVLPAAAVVHGVEGLVRIEDAVRGLGGRHVRAGTVSPGPRLLSRESLVTDFTTLLTPAGGQYDAIAGDAKDTRLPAGGLTLRARYGSGWEVYRVNQAELEHYEHITATAGGLTVEGNTRGVSGAGTVLLPVAPGVAVGPRIAAALNESRATSHGSSLATEHRSWDRRITEAYHVYAPVTFTITVRGASTEVVGAIEVVVDRPGALDMGIPADVLPSAEVREPAPVGPPVAEPVAEPDAEPIEEASERPVEEPVAPSDRDLPLGPTIADVLAGFDLPVVQTASRADGGGLLVNALGRTDQRFADVVGRPVLHHERLSLVLLATSDDQPALAYREGAMTITPPATPAEVAAWLIRLGWAGEPLQVLTDTPTFMANRWFDELADELSAARQEPAYVYHTNDRWHYSGTGGVRAVRNDGSSGRWRSAGSDRSFDSGPFAAAYTGRLWPRGRPMYSLHPRGVSFVVNGDQSSLDPLADQPDRVVLDVVVRDGTPVALTHRDEGVLELSIADLVDAVALVDPGRPGRERLPVQLSVQLDPPHQGVLIVLAGQLATAAGRHVYYAAPDGDSVIDHRGLLTVPEGGGWDGVLGPDGVSLGFTVDRALFLPTIGSQPGLIWSTGDPTDPPFRTRLTADIQLIALTNAPLTGGPAITDGQIAVPVTGEDLHELARLHDIGNGPTVLVMARPDEAQADAWVGVAREFAREIGRPVLVAPVAGTRPAVWAYPVDLPRHVRYLPPIEVTDRGLARRPDGDLLQVTSERSGWRMVLDATRIPWPRVAAMARDVRANRAETLFLDDAVAVRTLAFPLPLSDISETLGRIGWHAGQAVQVAATVDELGGGAWLQEIANELRVPVLAPEGPAEAGYHPLVRDVAAADPTEGRPRPWAVWLPADWSTARPRTGPRGEVLYGRTEASPLPTGINLTDSYHPDWDLVTLDDLTFDVALALNEDGQPMIHRTDHWVALTPEMAAEAIVTAGLPLDQAEMFDETTRPTGMTAQIWQGQPIRLLVDTPTPGPALDGLRRWTAELAALLENAYPTLQAAQWYRASRPDQTLFAAEPPIYERVAELPLPAYRTDPPDGSTRRAIDVYLPGPGDTWAIVGEQVVAWTGPVPEGQPGTWQLAWSEAESAGPPSYLTTGPSGELVEHVDAMVVPTDAGIVSAATVDTGYLTDLAALVWQAPGRNNPFTIRALPGLVVFDNVVTRDGGMGLLASDGRVRRYPLRQLLARLRALFGERMAGVSPDSIQLLSRFVEGADGYAVLRLAPLTQGQQDLLETHSALLAAELGTAVYGVPADAWPRTLFDLQDVAVVRLDGTPARWRRFPHSIWHGDDLFVTSRAGTLTPRGAVPGEATIDPAEVYAQPFPGGVALVRSEKDSGAWPWSHPSAEPEFLVIAEGGLDAITLERTGVQPASAVPVGPARFASLLPHLGWDGATPIRLAVNGLGLSPSDQDGMVYDTFADELADRTGVRVFTPSESVRWRRVEPDGTDVIEHLDEHGNPYWDAADPMPME